MQLTETQSKLIETYLPDAHRLAGVAKATFDLWVPVEELLPWAEDGLIHAARNFNPDKGSKWSTYLQMTIGFYCRAGNRRRSKEVAFEQPLDQVPDRLLIDPRTARREEQFTKHQYCVVLLKKIKPTDRKVILMLIVDKMHQRDVGKSLGLSATKIWTDKSRILNRLREIAAEMERAA